MGPNKSLRITILTGEKGQGKTSWLVDHLGNASGILSPLKEGKRFFLLLPDKIWIPMENLKGDLSVGKYIFDQNAFDLAEAHLRSKMNEEVLILDEVGPLELKGEGFKDLLLFLKHNYLGTLYLVVRSGLVKEVLVHFGFSEFNPEIIRFKTLIEQERDKFF